MKITTSLKMDLRGMEKLRRQLRMTQVDVGWLEGVNHWNSNPNNPITVPALAAHLQYNSPWAGQVLLDPYDSTKVSRIVSGNLRKSFGVMDFKMVANAIGSDLRDFIKVSIKNVSSPSNAPTWAAIKSFNDPLVYGSYIGNTPNLISELGWEVR